MECQLFSVHAAYRLAVNVLDVSWIPNSKDKVGSNDRAGAKTHLSLVFIQEVASKCVVTKLRRCCEIDES